MIRSNITHSREDRIREEIAKNGPVTAGFLVPRDFYFYKKGKYDISSKEKYNTSINSRKVTYQQSNYTHTSLRL